MYGALADDEAHHFAERIALWFAGAFADRLGYGQEDQEGQKQAGNADYREDELPVADDADAWTWKGSTCRRSPIRTPPTTIDSAMPPITPALRIA